MRSVRSPLASTQAWKGCPAPGTMYRTSSSRSEPKLRSMPAPIAEATVVARITANKRMAVATGMTVGRAGEAGGGVVWEE